MEENTFHSDLEKESFLFQVSEKESGIDQEGFNKVRQYEQGEFERKASDNPIYQKTLSFETEKNRHKVYSLYLEYINRWGMPLIGPLFRLRVGGCQAVFERKTEAETGHPPIKDRA